MKKVVVCMCCNRKLPMSLAYQAAVEEWVTNPITGQKGTQVLEGYLCPKCNLALGYVTSKKKLAKWTGGDKNG